MKRQGRDREKEAKTESDMDRAKREGRQTDRQTEDALCYIIQQYS